MSRKRDISHLQIGAFAIGLAVLLLVIDMILFRDARYLATSVLINLAIMFVQIVLVTVILDRFISDREKKRMLEKMNMVIGVFFTEAGSGLISLFTAMDPALDSFRTGLVVTNKWGEDEFATEHDAIRKHEFTVTATTADLEKMHAFLRERRDFFLRLLENPVLLEHETFTELLRAVFHLAEELASRASLDNLPRTDVAHIEGDVKRAYALLVDEWLVYMEYLKSNYPYLFSHAVRTNPFDASATPVVMQ